MKIAIVGTGAMGAVYAALLKKAGHEVWAIDSWDEHLESIDSDGLRVSGASGSYVVDGIRIGATPADAGPSDVWIVATKAADVDAVMGGIATLLRPDDVVMPFQNGLGAGERVARHVPEDHVVIGIAEGF
jgi:2-dehydropantoate 2-reductase